MNGIVNINYIPIFMETDQSTFLQHSKTTDDYRMLYGKFPCDIRQPCSVVKQFGHNHPQQIIAATKTKSIGAFYENSNVLL